MVRPEVEIEKLVESFAHHAAAQAGAIFKGDARTGNKHVKQVIAAFDKLCAYSNVGRNALTTLFTHPPMDVRVKAAAFLLHHRTTEEAQAVLRAAADGEGLAALSASEALRRWEDGTW
ncbi:MAG TPA: DUF2019 domain-containing protein, partial [Archangium sp.]|nr:DUF2019 domain-containing protein [Archangium sp.]